MPSRRAVLAGLLGVGAGCAGRPNGPATDRSNGSDGSTEPNDSTGNESTTASPSEETENGSDPGDASADSVSIGDAATLGDAQVVVDDPRRRFSALTVQADTADVVTFDERLLLVGVSAEGETQPPRSAFSFAYDGERYESYLDDGEPAYQFYHLPDAYVPGEQEGWIGFEVPEDVYTHRGARFVVEHGGETAAWPLPGGVDVGGPPPAFDLVSFETPETVGVGESATATVTVKNAGGPAHFRGSVNTGGVLHAAETFSFEVPNGETETREVFSYAPQSSGELRLSLVGTGGVETERRTVTVE
jgi:hypothetical protein